METDATAFATAAVAAAAATVAASASDSLGRSPHKNCKNDLDDQT